VYDGARVVELVRVIDGDSLEVSADGEEIEVRLIGINAPERFTLGDDESCAGDQARAVLEEALSTAGELRLDGSETDRYGRLLARVEADGASVNQSLVEAGWALALWSAENPALTGSMMEAAEATRGWWGPSCGQPVAVVEVSGHQVDPPGRDDENLDQEWVEIRNPGNDPIELAGWTIRDDTTSNRFELPAHILVAGASVKVHTGSGPDGPNDLYLDERSPVWSNGGETVLVLDPEGRIAGYAFVST
jgi:micrococcal nuclease